MFLFPGRRGWSGRRRRRRERREGGPLPEEERVVIKDIQVNPNTKKRLAKKRETRERQKKGARASSFCVGLVFVCCC